MTKISTTTGKTVETELNVQAINVLMKNNQLIRLNDGSMLNPHLVESVTPDAPQPYMVRRVDNFHIPTKEEQDAAQYALQPLKRVFEERAQFDKNLIAQQREAINTQAIYGAQKQINQVNNQEQINTIIPTPIPTPIPDATQTKPKRGRPAKKKD